MPYYRYRALAPDGSLLRGSDEADSREALLERLHHRGHVPIDAVQDRPARRWHLQLQRDGETSPAALALVTEQWAAMLEAGLPVDRSLELLLNVSTPPALRKALERVLQAVRTGQPLHEALAHEPSRFSSLFVGLVRAGETTASLPNSLRIASSFLTRTAAVRARLVSALTYPAILVLVACLALVFVSTVVLPDFASFLDGTDVDLPLVTLVLLRAGHVLASYWWLVLGLVLGLALACRQALRQPRLRARADAALLQVPVLGELVTTHQAALFSRTLGVALSSGLTVPQGVALARDVLANRAFQRTLEKVVQRLREGENLAVCATETTLFPPVVIDLIRTGEETGRLAPLLLQLATLLESDVDRSLQRLLAMLVPAVTVLVGLLIGVVVVSIFSALLSINALAT